MSAAVKRKIPVNSVEQEVGRVVRVTPEAFVVRSGGTDDRAVRARSCLVEPGENDEVLLALAADGRAFVLAVLEEAQPDAKTVIAVDGDLELTSRAGRADIGASEGIRLTSGSDVDVVGNEIRMRAAATTLVTEGLALVGPTVRIGCGKTSRLGRGHSAPDVVRQQIEVLASTAASRLAARVPENAWLFDRKNVS